MLPKSERLVNQLCGLERRVGRSGKDSIDHGPGAHDDLANSVAGCADLVGSHKPMVVSRELLARALMPSPLARGRQRLTELPPCRSSQGIQAFSENPKEATTIQLGRNRHCPLLDNSGQSRILAWGVMSALAQSGHRFAWPLCLLWR